MVVTEALAPVAALDRGDRDELRTLLERHFSGVDHDGFAADLRAKTHVLRLRRGDRLVGFTTLEYRPTTVAGAPAAVLYSGDTIVDPAAWGEADLGAAWVAAVLDLHAASMGEDRPLWWLLIASGVRTYRYLTACVRRYAPAPVARLDPDALELLPGLAARRFGEAYDPASGIVRLPRPQRLRAHLAGVPERLAADPDVQRFLRSNPGHADGDELASLCRLSAANLTPLGRRALRRGRAAR